MPVMSQSQQVKSSGRPQKTDAEREFQRARLLSAATRTIREHGPDVSLDTIAAAAGYTKPVLYELFGSKAGLAIALSFQLFGDRFESHLGELRVDPKAAIRGLIEGYVDAVQTDPNLYRFVVVGGRSGTASLVDQPLFQYFVPMVSAGVAIREPYDSIVAQATFSMVFATIESWSLNQQISAAELVTLLETMVHTMLQAAERDYRHV